MGLLRFFKSKSNQHLSDMANTNRENHDAKLGKIFSLFLYEY